MYRIVFSNDAKKDLKELSKKAPQAVKKLSRQEREHTLVELARMEKVRRFMLDNNIMDKDSFDDYRKEL